MLLTAEQEAHAKSLKELLGQAQSASGEARALLLKEAAEVASELRLSFPRSEDDPTPDVGGRSFAYQSVIRDVFAALEADTPLRNAFRYHMNNVMKRRVDPELLREYGIDVRTRLEQMEDQRRAQQAAAAAGRAIRSTLPADEQLRTLAQAQAMLSTVDIEGLAELEGAHRDDAAQIADTIITLAQRVLRVTE